MNEQVKIVRLREVVSLTGLSRSTTYSRIEDGLFTVPVPIGPQAVGWPLREVVAINSARISGKSDDAIRALVVELETARTGTPATPRRKQRREVAAA
jgi:prophage regulatory protein